MPRKGRKKRVIRYTGRRTSIRFFLLFLMLTVGAFLFSQSPFFNVSKVAITGNRSVPYSEAKRLSGVRNGENIFQVDTKSIKEKLLLNPMIASAEVKRKLPSTVDIKIKEFVPAAVIPVEEGFMEVSIEGYCLKISPEISRLNLPVISGLEIKKSVPPGKRVEQDQFFVAKEILECLGDSGTIAEIDVHDILRMNLFTFSKTKVLLGNDQQLQEKVSLALDISSRVPTAEYIDVRFPKSPVYK